MKIIKPGVQTPEVEAPWWIGKTFDCRACQCRVELEEKDTVGTCVEGKTGEIFAIYFNCPACGRRIAVFKPGGSWDFSAQTVKAAFPPASNPQTV